MLRVMVGAVLAFCLVSGASRAEDENPYKNAKVGDWAKYKMAIKAGGTAMESEQKQTVTARTETEVTIEMVMVMGGKENKATFTVKLNEKFEPYKMKNVETEVKEGASGSEALTINGKSVDTKWKELEVINKLQGTEMKSKVKLWFSPDVKLGLAKMESDSGAMGKTTLELVDFGGEK
jgi:hypothetical protein